MKKHKKKNETFFLYSLDNRAKKVYFLIFPHFRSCCFALRFALESIVMNPVSSNLWINGVKKNWGLVNKIQIKEANNRRYFFHHVRQTKSSYCLKLFLLFQKFSFQTIEYVPLGLTSPREQFSVLYIFPRRSWYCFIIYDIKHLAMNEF